MLANSALAETQTTAPDVFNLTIYEISLCAESTCAAPQSLGSNSAGALFDIASANIGDVVGSFVGALDNIDNNEYTHAKFIMAREYRYAGEIVSSISGLTYYTNGSGTDYTTEISGESETQTNLQIGLTTDSASKSEVTTSVADSIIAAVPGIALNSDTSKVDYVIELTSSVIWNDNSKYLQYALDIDISETLIMSDENELSVMISDINPPAITFSTL